MFIAVPYPSGLAPAVQRSPLGPPDAGVSACLSLALKALAVSLFAFWGLRS